MKSQLLYIRLVSPDPPSSTLLDPSKSWLLSGISSYPDLDLYGFGAPGLRKSPELGRVFAGVEPDENGAFKVEIGGILPDLLPNLNGSVDYSVDIVDDEAELHTLCVSNQMVKVPSRQEGQQYHVILPRCFVPSLAERIPALEVSEESPQELLKTVVTSRFEIKGSDPEDALENHIDEMLERFVSLLNRFLAANQMLVSEEAYPGLPGSYDRATFDAVYLLVQGMEPNVFSHGRLTLNAGRMALAPPSLDGDKADQLLALLNGTESIDDIRSMMLSAKNSISGGLLRYGLLQTVIAGEMATAKFVGKSLQAKGVSRKKWNESGKDITYSMMLNIHLPALAPAHLKPDLETVGILNRARSLRNQLMHEGTFTLKHGELLRIHQATERFLKYLKLLDAGAKSPDEESGG